MTSDGRLTGLRAITGAPVVRDIARELPVARRQSSSTRTRQRREANPPAIVFSGEAIGLRVQRSLARAGVSVYGVGSPHSLLRYSRHRAGYASLGSKFHEDNVFERWFEWLEDGAPRGAVLLPCTDEGLQLVLRHRARLEELGYLPIEANDDVLAAMLDKERTYELARSIGIQAPATVTLRTVDDLAAVADQLEYPCAIKPLHSNLFARHFGDRNKLLVARDPGELKQGWARMNELGLEVMVTEIVPGGDDRLLSYCGYLDERGEPLTEFTFRKMRQCPPHFGLGCYVVSDWNPEVADAGLRFLRGIGLRGLFHVEFKRDSRDDQLKLIECNHRFTIELVFSPTNLPLLTYNRLLGRPLPSPGPYRAGKRLWNPVEDTKAARSYRRHGELSWAQWLRSLLHLQQFHAFRWDDPVPTMAFHRRKLTRALVRRFGPPRASPSSEPLLPR
jgi:D-aspartate ligase